MHAPISSSYHARNAWLVMFAGLFATAIIIAIGIYLTPSIDRPSAIEVHTIYDLGVIVFAGASRWTSRKARSRLISKPPPTGLESSGV